MLTNKKPIRHLKIVNEQTDKDIHLKMLWLLKITL